MAKIKKNYCIDETAVKVLNEAARLVYMKPGEFLDKLILTHAPVFSANLKKVMSDSDVDMYNLFCMAGIGCDPSDFGIPTDEELRKEEADGGAE